MHLIHSLNNLLWGFPLLVLLLGTHLFFTIKLNFPQRHILKAIKLSLKGNPTASHTKNLSNFAVLTTTLAATLGTGNIIGISTAVALGGPGAVFWCWITGVFGMATSYAECFLSSFYREKHRNRGSLGGPMYVLEKGLHCRPLGILYSVLTLLAALGIGCMIQSNAINETLQLIVPLPSSVCGIVLALITGFIIIGGITSISKFCMKVIPTLGLLYILCCVVLLFLFRDVLEDTLILILQSAFQPTAVASGFISSTFLSSARYGIARGLFTNEAGMGTAAIAAGANESTTPCFQGLVSMTAVFWDTVVICALTGIIVVANIIKFPESVANIGNGNYTSAAFVNLPFIHGPTLLLFILITFAITTLIGWYYFGEVSLLYIFPKNKLKVYHFVYLLMIYLGSILPLDIVWSMADLINGLMIFPNLLCLWCLQSKIHTPLFVNTRK